MFNVSIKFNLSTECFTNQLHLLKTVMFSIKTILISVDGAIFKHDGVSFGCFFVFASTSISMGVISA